MTDTASRSQALFGLPAPRKDPLRQKLFSLVKGPLELTFRVRTLNRIYRDILNDGIQGSSFADQALARLNIGCEVRGRGLLSIPETGPLVVVANHPFGGAEGLVLASMLQRRRQDVKIMANYLLAGIPELKDIFLYVDPFEKRQSVAKNLVPLRKAMEWLKEGHVLAVFPAGSVSRLNLQGHRIEDPEWHNATAAIIRRAEAPVLPIFFEGVNSALFQAAGLIHPMLRTALLPRELLNKRNKNICVQVGSVLPFAQLNSFSTHEKLTAYLRMRTYGLKRDFPETGTIARLRPAGKEIFLPLQLIAPGPERRAVESDVEGLPAEQLLVKTGEYGVFYAKAPQIPSLLVEIGRLREITFRAAQEGTGRSIDLDRFDVHYTHLFVWNFEKRHVVGAYRFGQVDLILARSGKTGLYTSTLFDYRGRFLEHMKSSIELGRSFVRKEYQKLYAPLLLLWKGIAHFVALNPRYRTVFGPVSISRGYSALSRRLITTYLRTNHYDPHLARFVRARAGEGDRAPRGREFIEEGSLPRSLEELSALISGIEADRKGVPVMLRHYVKMGGRLMGFNVDPAFGYALDGLIIVDLLKCGEKILERYMGSEGAANFLCYHMDVLPLDLAS